MAQSKWICKNEDGCNKAFDNAGKTFEDLMGHEVESQLQPYKCEECGKDLEEVKKPGTKIDVKKIAIIAAAVLILGGTGYVVYKFISGDWPGEKPAVTTTIEPESPTVTVDETIKLTAKTDSEDAKLTWTWESSDENIAKVSRSGIVTGVAAGNVIITVTAEKNKNISAKAEVSVVSETGKVLVSIEPASSTVMVGNTITLTEQTDPEDAVRKLEWNWSSSDENIAKVKDGVVTGVAEGEVIIFVKDEKDRLSATASVTVQKKGEPPQTSPSGTISVSGGSYTGELKNGQPHGMGTIRYNSRTLIDSRDMKQRYAEAGQYITGEFYNSRLVQGRLFDSSNNHLETIILGRVN